MIFLAEPKKMKKRIRMIFFNRYHKKEENREEKNALVDVENVVNSLKMMRLYVHGAGKQQEWK